MPLGASTFRVRHYEYGVLGHLDNTDYLRRIMEVTIRTLTSVGCDPGRLGAPHYARHAHEVFVDLHRAADLGPVRLTRWRFHVQCARVSCDAPPQTSELNHKEPEMAVRIPNR